MPLASDDTLTGGVVTASKVTASDGSNGFRLGYSVAATADGSLYVSGSPNHSVNNFRSGAAYLYDGNGNQLAILTANDWAASDQFGHSVSVSDDGSTVIVGSWNDDDNGADSGAAYVFDALGNQITKLTASDGAAGNLFGVSVATSANGSLFAVGSQNADTSGNNHGAVYLYDATGTQTAILTRDDPAANDFFGYDTSISADGSTIAVSAFGDDNQNGIDAGAVYIFNASGTQLAKLTASDGAANDWFGRAISVSADGSRILVGASWEHDQGMQTGAAYLFDSTGNELFKLSPSNLALGDEFGRDLAISADGSTLVVSSPGYGTINSGAVYVFDATGTQIAKLTSLDTPAGNLFGQSVSVSADGSSIIIGADGDQDNGSYSGAVYTFVRNADGNYVGPDGTVYDANGPTTQTASTTVDLPFVSEDETAAIATADLLANDTDAEGDTLSITSVSATSTMGATVTLADTNSDGTYDEIVYDPTAAALLQALDQGTSTTDTFTYTVSDGNGGTDTATVSITVGGADEIL